MNNKAEEAKNIVERCLGKNGVWASPFRYKYQCWTRDFVIAIEDLLLEEGKGEIVKKHLTNLAKRQSPDGQIPIMFLDSTPKWLALKVWQGIRNWKIPFLLRGYFSKGGVGQLSPWTRDSEFLFALGIAKYAIKTGDTAFLSKYREKIDNALSYVEKNLMKGGLVAGGDWRDTRPDLDNSFLMTNNCLLFQAYTLLGEDKKAEQLKAMINEKLWTGTYYRDYIGVDNFDTLGNALAILFGIAPKENYSSIIISVSQLDTSHGYKLYGVTLPSKSNTEAEVIQKADTVGIIWPFIHGFMILAEIKAGDIDTATKQYDKWAGLPGFFEFYDPLTGNGYGSIDQVWSAALYLRVGRALGR